jgi:hypothetical protein
MKLVFKKKSKENGKVTKYKAHLVAKVTSKSMVSITKKILLWLQGKTQLD